VGRRGKRKRGTFSEAIFAWKVLKGNVVQGRGTSDGGGRWASFENQASRKILHRDATEKKKGA